MKRFAGIHGDPSGHVIKGMLLKVLVSILPSAIWEKSVSSSTSE
jgi:hypothetical protein